MSTSDADSKPQSAPWKSLSRKLRLLTVLIAATGLLILIWSGWKVAGQSYDGYWVFLMIMALSTVPLAVFLPQLEALVVLGEPYLMAIAMLYGTSACTVATACYGLIIVLWYGYRDIARMIFNLSAMICGAFLYSAVFHLFEISHVYGFFDMIYPAATMALVS